MDAEKFKSFYIVIVTFLVGVLLTYIVCDKFIMKKEEAKESSKVTETLEANEQLEEKRVEPKKNSYPLFAENMKKERERFDEYYYSTMRFLNPMLEIPSYDIILKSNGELYYNDQKLVNQVLSYSVIPTGNGGYQMLYFIFENGKVGCANIEESSSLGTDITITTDLGYSDIVSIVGGVMGSENAPGTHGPIFIDIHGNMFHEYYFLR